MSRYLPEISQLTMQHPCGYCGIMFTPSDRAGTSMSACPVCEPYLKTRMIELIQSFAGGEPIELLPNESQNAYLMRVLPSIARRRACIQFIKAKCKKHREEWCIPGDQTAAAA